MGERLCIRHHTAVELVNCLSSRAKMIRGMPDAFTFKSKRLIETLSHAHLKELQSIRPSLEYLIAGLY